MRIVRVVVVLFGLIFLWFAAVLDLSFHEGILSPRLVLTMAAMLGCGLIGWIMFRRPCSLIRLIGIVGFCAAFISCLAPLRATPTGRLRTAYQAIHPGMTQASLRDVLDRNFTRTEIDKTYDSSDAVFWRIFPYPHSGVTIEIEMKQDQVVSTRLAYD